MWSNERGLTMDYLESTKNEIRERWFENHKIKSIEGNEGFQRIIWGEEGTRMYQVNYVLAGNMVFVAGDLGDAVYELTCAATLENIKDFNLSYFTGKLTASQRDKYDFDDKLAREQIESDFKSWCDVDSISELEEETKELYEELIGETHEWNRCDHFQNGVYAVYNNTSVDWFDSECASSIADNGQRLSRCFIAYWLGLQMLIEQLEAQKELTV